MAKAILVVDIGDEEIEDLAINYLIYRSSEGKVIDGDMGAILTPMPEKIDILEQSEKDFDSYPDGEYLADKLVERQGYKRHGCCTDVYHGWNACIDEILGEAE